MTGKIRILIINMGLTSDVTREKYGEFSDWFLDALGRMRTNAEASVTTAWDVTREMLLGCDGIILTGAEEGVYDELPWRERFDPMIKAAIADKKPVLGVCFSHQYLAELLGGAVENNPEKKEYGRQKVVLTEKGFDDPLFISTPDPAMFLFSHNDVVTKLPPKAVLLAKNDLVQIEAFRVGETVYGVQFHPELNNEITAQIILDCKFDEAETAKWLATLDGNHDGYRILRNFLEICEDWKTI